MHAIVIFSVIFRVNLLNLYYYAMDIVPSLVTVSEENVSGGHIS